MDSGSSVLILHKPFVSKNNFVVLKTSENQLSTMAGSFPTSHQVKMKLKLPWLDIMLHISTPFHLDLIWELGIWLDFQKKQNINKRIKKILDANLKEII